LPRDRGPLAPVLLGAPVPKTYRTHVANLAHQKLWSLLLKVRASPLRPRKVSCGGGSP
jgi:hypothetical protein